MIANMDFLKGAGAVMTGGASGIGLGVAEALAAQGCYVVIGDVNSAEGEKVAASNPMFKFVKCDVEKKSDLEAMATACESLPCGSASVWFNNTGCVITCVAETE